MPAVPSTLGLGHHWFKNFSAAAADWLEGGDTALVHYWDSEVGAEAVHEEPGRGDPQEAPRLHHPISIFGRAAFPQELE